MISETFRVQMMSPQNVPSESMVARFAARTLQTTSGGTATLEPNHTEHRTRFYRGTEHNSIGAPDTPL